MSIAAITGLIALPILLLSVLLPVALVVALQVWLCKRKTRWLGLILPGLSLLFSLLLVFGAAAFGGLVRWGSAELVLEQNGDVVERQVTENGMVTVYDGDGNVVEQYPDPNAQENQGRTSLESALTVGGIFLVGNIPTVVLGGIWLHYKNRRDFQDELHRMSIQDLG